MLIIEDGSGVSGAESFVSAADHVAYCALYGLTVTEEQAEINLRNFMDYMVTLRYKGKKTYPTTTNTLPFPRTGVYIDGVLLASDEIPADIIKAENEGARSIAMGVDPLAIHERAVKTETFGPFSKTYMDNANTVNTNPRVTLFLQPYLSYESSGIHFKVITDKERCINHNDNLFGEDGYSYYE